MSALDRFEAIAAKHRKFNEEIDAAKAPCIPIFERVSKDLMQQEQAPESVSVSFEEMQSLIRYAEAMDKSVGISRARDPQESCTLFGVPVRVTGGQA